MLLPSQADNNSQTKQKLKLQTRTWVGKIYVKHTLCVFCLRSLRYGVEAMQCVVLYMALESSVRNRFTTAFRRRQERKNTHPPGRPSMIVSRVCHHQVPKGISCPYLEYLRVSASRVNPLVPRPRFATSIGYLGSIMGRGTAELV